MYICIMMCLFNDFIIIVTIGRLIISRTFNDSFFCSGEPNLVLVPSGKLCVYMYVYS